MIARCIGQYDVGEIIKYQFGLMFDPIYLMAFLAFATFLWVRRSGAAAFCWKPNASTWVAVSASIAIFAISAVLTLPGMPSDLKSAILHIGMYVAIGVWLPLFWNFRIEKAGFEGIGIRLEGLGLSVLVNIVLGAFLTAIMVMQADWSRIEQGTFWAALFVLITGNFFELIFYYGFVHLRFRKAFGPVIGVVVTAFLYVLWHLGTELMLVEDVWATAIMLFAVGILFQSVFALTYNLAIIFPFFVAGGVMLDFAVNIEALDRVAPFVGWSVAAWVLFAIGFAVVLLARRSANNGPKAAI